MTLPILKETKLDLEENVNAILSLPILWYEIGFPIVKHASRYTFKISGVDFIHVSTMELNSIFEILSADQELDKVKFLTRIDPLDYQ